MEAVGFGTENMQRPRIGLSVHNDLHLVPTRAVVTALNRQEDNENGKLNRALCYCYPSARWLVSSVQISSLGFESIESPTTQNNFILPRFISQKCT